MPFDRHCGMPFASHSSLRDSTPTTWGTPHPDRVMRRRAGRGIVEWAVPADRAREEPIVTERTAEAPARAAGRYQLDTELTQLTTAERVARGKAARARVPREAHA